MIVVADCGVWPVTLMTSWSVAPPRDIQTTAVARRWRSCSVVTDGQGFNFQRVAIVSLAGGFRSLPAASPAGMLPRLSPPP